MTAREKLELEHPERVNVGYIGGCLGCPSDYGYLFKPMYCRDPSYGSCLKQCTDCWDREIPEEPKAYVKDNEVHVIADGEDHVIETPFEPRPSNDIHGELQPKILDSGNRRQFESGAVRDIQEGKGRCDLLPLDVVADIYEEFYSYDHPDISEVLCGISQFQATGGVKYLYYALDNFECFEAWSNMFLEVAIHFEEGAKKYGENNWQKGIPVHCYIDSAVRHYLKFLRGDKDEPHDRAFCWNILCAIWTCKHKPELNEYAQKDLDFPKRDYDPVARAYDIAKSAYNGDQSNVAYALEEIVGYLGEALD